MRSIRSIQRLGSLSLLATVAWQCFADTTGATAAPMPKTVGAGIALRPASTVSLSSDQLIVLAHSLVQRFFERLASTGLPKGELGYANGADKEAIASVRAILDPAFLVQRADGSFETYDSYLPVDIDDFTISDLHATRPADNLIAVRYSVTTENSLVPLTGRIGSANKEPRLSIFRYDPKSGDWLLVSHANFNPPIAQICSHLKPPERPTASLAITSPPALISLARQTTQRWYRDLAADGHDLASPGGLLLPKAQLLYGDGYGRDGDSGYRTVKVSQTTTRNFVVRQHDDVIVMRFDALNQLRIADRTFSDRWQPRLVTMVRHPVSGDSPTWKIAGFAIFSFPRLPPEGVPCRK